MIEKSMIETQRVLVVATDEVGDQILSALSRFTKLLPEPIQIALMTMQSDKGKLDKVTSLKAELTKLRQGSLSDNIKAAGGQLESAEQMQRLHIVFVGALDKAIAQADLIKDFLKGSSQGSSHSLHNMNMMIDVSGSGSMRDSVINCQNTFPNASNVYFDKCIEGGDLIQQADACEVVAGALATMLLPINAEPISIHTKSKAWAVGFSGLFGIAGISHDRLVCLGIEKLIEKYQQLNRIGENPITNPRKRQSPDWLKKTRDTINIFALVYDLFGKNSTSDLEILATMNWENNSLLNVNLTSVPQVEMHSKPIDTWPDEIHAFSRSIDMTQATIWKKEMSRRVSSIVRRVFGQIEKSLCSTIHNDKYGLLDANNFLHELEDISERYDKDTSTLPISTGQIDGMLKKLDSLIKNRPAPLSMSLHMAIWCLPALVGVVHLSLKLFNTPISLIAAILLPVIILTSSIYWLWSKYDRYTKELYSCRDRCIGEIKKRQESILSYNALGYGGEINQRLKDGLERYKMRQASIEELINELLIQTRERFNTSSSQAGYFKPLLSKRKHFETVYNALVIDEEDYISRLLSDYTQVIHKWCPGIYSSIDTDFLSEFNNLGVFVKIKSWYTERLKLINGFPGLKKLSELLLKIDGEEIIERVSDSLSNSKCLTDIRLPAVTKTHIVFPASMEDIFGEIAQSNSSIKREAMNKFDDLPYIAFLKVSEINYEE